MKLTEGLSLPTIYYFVTYVRRTLLVKIHSPAPGLKVQPLNLICKPGPAHIVITQGPHGASYT